MAKNKTFGIVIVVVAVIAVFLLVNSGGSNSGVQSITGGERVRIIAPASVGVGDTFQLAYDVSGASGSWAIPMEISVNGQCTLATEKPVLFNDRGTTQSHSETAPNNPGQCVYSGIYAVAGQQFNLNSATVQVLACIPSCQWNTVSACGTSANDGCGSTCNRIVQQLTEIDTNCNNKVDITELSNGITLWSNDQLGITVLSQAITDWASR